MQELVGRLTALDPEATESLKVIAYFDALIDGRATPEVLLRGAAVLSGCAAGFVSPHTAMRVDASGRRAAMDAARRDGAQGTDVHRGNARGDGAQTDPAAGGAGAWTEHGLPVAGGARAWIEREGRAHANDAMILERLAISLSITLERSSPVAANRRAVELVIDASESLEKRMAAAVRLKLDAEPSLRVIAQPAGEPVGESDEGFRHSTVVVTAVGAIRAVVVDASARPLAARAGLGLVGDAAGLDRSWASALLALRLTSARRPVLAAEELGSVLLLAEAADAHELPHPDRVAIERVLAEDRRALGVLEALLESESIRSAALVAGVHHSTMQVRATELSEQLGYDVRTPAGRMRLSLALSLHDLATNRFA